jgi:hypothetical protein
MILIFPGTYHGMAEDRGHSSPHDNINTASFRADLETALGYHVHRLDVLRRQDRPEVLKLYLPGPHD